MNKASAIHKFFNSFGIPAYLHTSVPDGAEYPYMVYDSFDGMFGDGEFPLNLRVYYKTYSEKEPNKKVQEISKVIGLGGAVIECDSGAIWIKRGSPFCQSVVNDDDDSIKMRYINLDIEFLTME